MVSFDVRQPFSETVSYFNNVAGWITYSLVDLASGDEVIASPVDFFRVGMTITEHPRDCVIVC